LYQIAFSTGSILGNGVGECARRADLVPLTRAAYFQFGAQAHSAKGISTFQVTGIATSFHVRYWDIRVADSAAAICKTLCTLSALLKRRYCFSPADAGSKSLKDLVK
jgi:hypothetical protein